MNVKLYLHLKINIAIRFSHFECLLGNISRWNPNNKSAKESFMTAPSHYPNLNWFIITGVLWPSPEKNGHILESRYLNNIVKINYWFHSNYLSWALHASIYTIEHFGSIIRLRNPPGTVKLSFYLLVAGYPIWLVVKWFPCPKGLSCWHAGGWSESVSELSTFRAH